MPTNTPNMSLPNPTIGVDTGLTWEQSVNAANLIVDGHNHAAGSGVPIIPAGININSELAFNDNNATLLRSARFQIQSAALSDPLDLGCLYVTGVDLYFNDENGNQIQLTSGGSVNATTSGISDGNASASFVSSVLVVYSDNTTSPPTPADISGASLLLGLPTASSNRITLSPPASLVGGSYSLVLPAIPASSLFVTLDTSGNLGTSTNIQGTQIAANSLTGSQLANATVTGGKIAAATIQHSNMAILRLATSGLVSQSTSSTSDVVITGLAATITTGGGPVVIGFASTGGLRFATNGAAGFDDYGIFSIFRDGVFLSSSTVGVMASAIRVPAGGLGFVDTGASAGTHTYSCRFKVNSASGSSMVFTVTSIEIQVYEI